MFLTKKINLFLKHYLIIYFLCSTNSNAFNYQSIALNTLKKSMLISQTMFYCAWSAAFLSIMKEDGEEIKKIFSFENLNQNSKISSKQFYFILEKIGQFQIVLSVGSGITLFNNFFNNCDFKKIILDPYKNAVIIYLAIWFCKTLMNNIDAESKKKLKLIK